MITLKNILIFAGGTIVGVIAGWYCCDRHYKKILEEYDEDNYDEAFEDDFDEENIETGTPEELENIDYAKCYKKADPAEQEHPNEDEGKAKGKGRPPKLISAEKFGEDGFTEVFLDFYTEDQALVIADETEAKEIDEARDWIGNALEKYGFATNAEPKIYVRNYDRKCDYQILKVWDRFSPPEAYE